MLELARQRADGVINRSKTRDTPCFPLAAKGRLGVWNSHRGNHLGQRSCASAKTGRTYGRKRSDQSTAQITLRGGGRPHMGSRHPGSLRLPEVTDTVEKLRKRIAVKFRPNDILSENRCSMPPQRGYGGRLLLQRQLPRPPKSFFDSPAHGSTNYGSSPKTEFSTISTQLGHEPSGCLPQIDQYC